MNPVLQRELLANLRSTRAFVLLGAFLVLLSAVVVGAWPQEAEVNLSNPTAARRMVELLFGGQFLLASLTAPAFAAGSLTSEKENKTYEMLLASALRPRTIVWGKWLASTAPSLLMTIASLPIVMLCIPLGGISFYEAAAACVALVAATAAFTMLSLFAGAYFTRTIAALIASYFVVLPASLLGLLLWQLSSGGQSERRLWIFFLFVPAAAAATIVVLFRRTCRRLWYPPDVGSEGRDVVDERLEMRRAVGLVLRRHEFPDRLFAPAKRTEPLADGANPMLDKELRSELFSQGTLMLRIVLQVSLLLAVPIMGACLFLRPIWAPWYFCYVLTFNLLTAPAFSAGSIVGERERRTLDMLLATTLAPTTIVWGKLLGGLRVSGVLTSFLAWPVVLACVLVPEHYPNFASFGLMLFIVGLTCLFTTATSLFCSIVCTNSSASVTIAYLTLGSMFWLTPACDAFAQTFFPDTLLTTLTHGLTVTSAAAVMFDVPLTLRLPDVDAGAGDVQTADWPIVGGHVLLQLAGIAGLLLGIGRQFASRQLRE